MHIFLGNPLRKIAVITCLLVLSVTFSACSKNTSADSDNKPTSPTPSAGFAPKDSNKTTAMGRAVDSARSIAATQLTAGQLLKRYSPQLKTLQSGLVQIQDEAAANPALLGGENGIAYQKLRPLVQELAEMLDTLRNYDSDGPTDIAGKLQADFARANELYTQVAGHSVE